MRVIFAIFLITSVATATALEPSKSDVSIPHLRGSETEERQLVSQLRPPQLQHVCCTNDKPFGQTDFGCNEPGLPNCDAAPGATGSYCYRNCDGLVANPDTIWPPNHKYVDVAIVGNSPCTITVNSIFQDEPLNTNGDGNTCADAMIHPLQVRAERSGTKKVPGDGRVYHIAYKADYGNGNICFGNATVCVPHDQGNEKGTCVDGGPLYDSTICA